MTPRQALDRIFIAIREMRSTSTTFYADLENQVRIHIGVDVFEPLVRLGLGDPTIHPSELRLEFCEPKFAGDSRLRVYGYPVVEHTPLDQPVPFPPGRIVVAREIEA